MDASDIKRVYGLAARVGSLEGYLYTGKDIEAEYLPGWLGNLEREFNELRPARAGRVPKIITKCCARWRPTSRSSTALGTPTRSRPRAWSTPPRVSWIPKAAKLVR